MPDDKLRKFLTEQNSIIHDLGSFGGKPKRVNLLINVAFFAIVVGCFVIGIISEKEFYQRLFLEGGILLISAKLAYFLYHFAKVAHFQFWALVALETKLDILTSIGQDIKKQAQESNAGTEQVR